MVSSIGGRVSDQNGLALMLGDSHSASAGYGISGGRFINVPKNKFMFFAKFFRPENQGGSDWQTSAGFAIKTVDRPKITFEHKVLNQYNKKRIVQTKHEFESIQMSFHDTVNESIQRMFVEYYQYYYGDSKITGAGTSVYDIVAPELYEGGRWGYSPQLAQGNYNYFFSHISIYQMFGGQVARFDLINPKILSFNPDELDYSSGSETTQIQMSLNFESIAYHPTQPITPEMAADFGLNRGQFYDVEVDITPEMSPGLALGPNEVDRDIFDATGQVLLRNVASGVTGQGGGNLGSIALEVASAFDLNRGIAVGKVGINSIKDLVTGNTGRGKQGVQGLLKGALFGRPGSLF